MDDASGIILLVNAADATKPVGRATGIIILKFRFAQVPFHNVNIQICLRPTEIV